MKDKRKPNFTLEMSRRFVREFLGRDWTPADFHGQVMREMAKLRKDYPEGDIFGALSALRDGLLGDVGSEIKSPGCLFWGEPPWINRWLEYKKTPPPVYEKFHYAEWSKRSVPEAVVLSSQIKLPESDEN